MKITKRQLRRIIKEAIADNVSLEIMLDGSGEPMTVEIPYYIVEDSIDDGASLDGLFIDIEDFIDSEYSPADTYNFSPAAEEVVKKMHADYSSGGVWSDQKDYEAGFMR